MSGELMTRFCAVVLGFACLPALAAQPSFLFPVKIQMRAPVTSIVGGDFNNDGIGDFVVTDGTSVSGVSR